MTRASSGQGAQVPTEVSLMGVRWDVASPLRARHVEERMEDRGVEVDHSTMPRWGIKDRSIYHTL